MKTGTFRIKDNMYWSEQIMDFIEYSIDEESDYLVTISLEKL